MRKETAFFIYLLERYAEELLDYLDEESRLVEKAQEQYLAKNEGTIPISDFL